MVFLYYLHQNSDMKRYIIIIISLFLFLGFSCDQLTLERDNPLDPKNSDSKRDRISLVEVFVNDNIEYSSYAEEGVEDLALNDYINRIAVIEYHIHSTSPDNYSNEVSDMQELIDRYNSLRNGKDIGLPDIYVNGKYEEERDNSIQGASSVESLKNRLGNVLDSEISLSYFTIEGSITRTNPIDLHITIARLGNTNAYNMRVKFAVLENCDEKYRYVLRDLIPERLLNIEAGDIAEMDVQSATITAQNMNNISGVVWIENETGNVLQSVIIQ